MQSDNSNSRNALCGAAAHPARPRIANGGARSSHQQDSGSLGPSCGCRLHQGETFRQRAARGTSAARWRFLAAARAGSIGEWTAGPVAFSAGTCELPGPQARAAAGGGSRKEQTNRQGGGATRRHVAVVRLRAPQRPYPQRGAQAPPPPERSAGAGFPRQSPTGSAAPEIVQIEGRKACPRVERGGGRQASAPPFFPRKMASTEGKCGHSARVDPRSRTAQPMFHLENTPGVTQ